MSLYRPFDEPFTALWTKAKSHLSAQYLAGLQKQVNDLVQSYACQDANFHDLHTNQQWLKNTAWQLGHADDVSLYHTRELLVSMASNFPAPMDLVSRLVSPLSPPSTPLYISSPGPLTDRLKNSWT